jgi:hypothetical protein
MTRNSGRATTSRPQKITLGEMREMGIRGFHELVISPIMLFRGMRFVTPSQLADPETAARKLIEIANAVEAVQDGRIHVELINRPFLTAGGTPAQYRAGLACAVSKGWLWRHESGAYVKFTPAGAELFA